MIDGDSKSRPLEWAAARRLRETVESLRDGLQLDAREAERLASAFDAALISGSSINESLGLNRSPYSLAIIERRRLLGLLVDTYPGSPTAIAHSIAIAAVRFEASTWSRCRMYRKPPPDLSVREKLLWQLQKNYQRGGAKWPLGVRSLIAEVQSLVMDVAQRSMETEAADD